MGMVNSNPKVQDKNGKGMKKSISTFWEQESDDFIPRKGQDWEFPLTPVQIFCIAHIDL